MRTYLTAVLAVGLCLGCSSSRSSAPSPSGVASSPPAAVTTLQANGGSGLVWLTWDAAPGATSYTVLRSSTSGSGYGRLATTTSSGFLDTAVAAGTTYSYEVLAVNGAGASLGSNLAKATTAPSVPGGAWAVAVPGTSTVRLSWTPSPTATRYTVERSTAGADYIAVANVSDTLYTDAATAPATPYAYRIRASNGVLSAPSQGISVQTAPAVPAQLTAASNGAGITLSWSAVPGATGYVVQRAPVDGALSTIQATPSAAFTDSSIQPNTQYVYSVQATNGTAGPAALAVALSAPAAPVLVATAGSNTVNLEWSPVVGAVSYSVFRSIGAGALALLATTASTSFIDTSVANGTAYSYAVAATNAAGSTGAASAPQGATPAAGALDASNLASSNGWILVSPGQQPGEVITVGTGGALAGIEASLAVGNGSPSNATVRLRVYDGDWQLLATQSIAASSLPSNTAPPALSSSSLGSGYFDLSSQGVLVSAGETLHAVFDSSDSSTFELGMSGAAMKAMTVGGAPYPYGDVNFKTLIVPQTTLPTPSLSSIHTGVGEAELAWSACPGAKSYAVARRLTQLPGGPVNPWTTLATVADAKFVDTSAAAGSSFDYQVTPVDAAGNAATPSAVTTVSVPNLVVDQNDLGASNGSIGSSSTQSPGQSFTVNTAGRLMGIEVAESIDGNSTQHAGNAILKVYDMAGTLLGSVSIPATSFDGGGAAPLTAQGLGKGYFNLSALGIAVTAGQQLRFEVTSDVSLSNTMYSTSGLAFDVSQTGTAYSGGSMTVNGAVQSSGTLNFKTVVAP